MKDNVVILNKVDYLFEGFQLLRQVATYDADEYDKMRQGILKKCNMDSKYRKTCDLAFKILEHANERFKDKSELIKQYFAEIEHDMIPAKLVLCCYAGIEQTVDVCRTVQDIRTEYEHLSDAEYDMMFLNMLDFDMDIEEFDRVAGCAERGVILEPAKRVCNIFNYIQKMDIKLESKMRIQEIYLNRNQYVDAICEVWEEACTLLHEYESDLQYVYEESAKRWQKTVDEKRFFPMLSSVMELDADALRNGACIVPSVMQYAILMIFLPGKLIPKRKDVMFTCRMGVLLGEEFNWNNQMEDGEECWEEMQPVFKALGDSSKADILMFIKDKPAYGIEIAKHFSLTTATVSHHMNKLVQLLLVQTEMRDGKVYYQTRTDKLCEVFEKGKKIFE